MSITETNIKTIRFFNNNIKKLDSEIIKTIEILESIHELLFGIYIKLEKERYLSIFLSSYKEYIYNKIFYNNNDNINALDYEELKKMITQFHIENNVERINLYYKSQYANVFNKLRLEYSTNELNKNIKNEIEIFIDEMRQDINYNIDLKFENFIDNINYNINTKIKDLKLELIEKNNILPSYIYQLIIQFFIYIILNYIFIFFA